MTFSATKWRLENDILTALGVRRRFGFRPDKVEPTMRVSRAGGDTPRAPLSTRDEWRNGECRLGDGNWHVMSASASVRVPQFGADAVSHHDSTVTWRSCRPGMRLRLRAASLRCSAELAARIAEARLRTGCGLHSPARDAMPAGAGITSQAAATCARTDDLQAQRIAPRRRARFHHCFAPSPCHQPSTIRVLL